MKLSDYVKIWLLLTALMGVESYLLNFKPKYSFSEKMVHHLKISNPNLSPDPGRPISYNLGWIGFSIMLATNLYILRKKLGWWNKIGTTKGWLDFHIFCGLMGPTFIVFHCNFIVRGLVAISFWSMMVSLGSGIVGRYLYLQLNMQKVELLQLADKWWDKFVRNYSRLKKNMEPSETEIMKEKIIKEYKLNKNYNESSSDAFSAFFSSLRMDIKLSSASIDSPTVMPSNLQFMLKQFIVFKRRAQLLAPLQRVMGYWHVFHLPFAIFMYIAAVIHIAAALILGVNA